ncbi:MULTISPECIES: TetR/AcrR family transcriptional regulator [unclassified Fusibacter]|uniref:TetR/AcrR family transcriptional regulator n=1 Tax=unclassified Fusibacter TaxID=2624464 RepID=UPI001011963E|nr:MULTISPECIES: TetR/AcrR family transcriptional regulator [unclassified Fusibacter]MCK8061342.1 TetR/AcrR family transcriptional regulator [Fusibacter sp. A2]NPE23461.1 TetR/AcrR family transcriptional regulator [Fusibacter sp. A1]RXV59068.1 TetR/AcrR family transcriptional regulator [Fusibacter sp. A1]
MRDAQKKESINLIIDGFFTLLNEKDYYEISMSEIAKASMVSRMTLYRYFDSKEEIFNFYINMLSNRINEEVYEENKSGIYMLLLKRNQLLYNNDYLKIAFKNVGSRELLYRISENSRLVISDYLSYKSKNSKIVSFVAGGISTITKEWILSGMETTPEDLTAEIIEIMDLIIEK